MFNSTTPHLVVDTDEMYQKSHEAIESFRDLEISLFGRFTWGFRRAYEQKRIDGPKLRMYTVDKEAPNEKLYMQAEFNRELDLVRIMFGPFVLDIDSESNLACFSITPPSDISHDLDFLYPENQENGVVFLRENNPLLKYFDKQLEKDEIIKRGFHVNSMLSFQSDRSNFAQAKLDQIMEIFNFNGYDRSRKYFEMDGQQIFPLADIKPIFYNFVMLTGVLTPESVDRLLKNGELTFENIVETLKLESRK